LRNAAKKLCGRRGIPHAARRVSEKPIVVILLDSSAVIALLIGESGAEFVEASIDDGAMLSVNLEEVIGFFTTSGAPPEKVRTALSPLGLQVLPHTEEMAWLSGELRSRLPSGLGIADRACLAAAAVLRSPVLTADGLWQAAAPAFGVTVRLIR
jgi:ribonuclease VapC